MFQVGTTQVAYQNCNFSFLSGLEDEPPGGRKIVVRLQIFGSHLVQNRGFLGMKCRNPPGPAFLGLMAMWLRTLTTTDISYLVDIGDIVVYNPSSGICG